MDSTTQLRHNNLNWRTWMTKRKKYTKEFKLDAISLVRDQNISVS